MRVYRRAASTTPRLLVVGLIVFGVSCSRKQQPPTPTPTPEPMTPPAARAPRAEAPVAITSGASLLVAMRARYADKWYKTLTFTQTTKLTLSSGSEVTQTWHEAAELPGRLRIDTDLAARNGVLYARDSIFTFASGKLVRADTGQNELLVLSFDIYAQPAERTQAVLERRGFDLLKFHEATWQGKPVYVVGALAGDTTSKQFWIDRERLLFVRLIQRSPQGRQDTRIDDYLPVGGGWIAREAAQFVNGKTRLRESRANVQADVALSPALFDARQWATAPR